MSEVAAIKVQKHLERLVFLKMAIDGEVFGFRLDDFEAHSSQLYNIRLFSACKAHKGGAINESSELYRAYQDVDIMVDAVDRTMMGMLMELIIKRKMRILGERLILMSHDITQDTLLAVDLVEDQYLKMKKLVNIWGERLR